MSQLQKRLSPNLRLEWKLFDQEKASAIEFLSLCEKMIKVGEFLLAHDVARAGLKKFKKHKRLSQRAGHALSKAGSPMMATKILEELVAGGDRDVETHSLLASAYKDLWEYSSDQSSKSKYAELAIARYQEAYLTNSFDSLRLSQRQELETQYYPCINIAFMHFLSGDLEKGRENAEKARQICRKLKEQGTSDYWIQVTEAEALLLLGSIEEAASAYADAVSSGDAEPSQIASTRKQALQIAAVYEDEAIFEEISFAFPKLGIVACSGHVIDSPGGARRFPPEAEPEVKRKIEDALASMERVAVTVRPHAEPTSSFLRLWPNGVGKLMFFFPLPRRNLSKQASGERAAIGWPGLKRYSIRRPPFITSRGKATMAKILCIPFVTTSCSDSPPCGAGAWMKIRNYSFSGMGKGGRPEEPESLWKDGLPILTNRL